MSEAEFNLLLDAVRAAIEPVAADFAMPGFEMIDAPPRAANDNGGAWPLLPFPEGWYAAC